MDAESFKKIGNFLSQGKIETQYKVHEEKARFLSKHPQPNSVVVASSEVQCRAKQVPIPPSKESRKVDTFVCNMYNFAALVINSSNYQ
ncbi:hypothetical protein JRQ81_008013, partial [Phrynocephalus forsythii]